MSESPTKPIMLFVIDGLFRLQHGLVIVGERTLAGANFRIGDRIMIAARDGSRVSTTIAGIDIPRSQKHLWALLLPSGVTEQDCPKGAKVWWYSADDR